MMRVKTKSGGSKAQSICLVSCEMMVCTTYLVSFTNPLASGEAGNLSRFEQLLRFCCTFPFENIDLALAEVKSQHI